jgi:hypothetical protein
MPSPSSPPAALPPTRAQLVRLEADLATARLRVERAVVDQSGAGPDDEAEAAARVLAAEADLAELEEALGTAAAPVVAPPEFAANDTTPPLPGAPANEDDWLTTKEAAAVMRVTVSGLERMRATGRGPAFTRIGRAVRYRRRDLAK